MLCENGNIQEFASKICQLIEDEQLRKNMGNQAAISIQRYTLDNIMSQWDQLFKEIDKNRSKEA
jgi:glycosyltransferase involved in cell wall biosynthesis